MVEGGIRGQATRVARVEVETQLAHHMQVVLV